MKSAIYIEDGRAQLVLTAETDTDRAVLDRLARMNHIRTTRGSFYRSGHFTMHGSNESSLLVAMEHDTTPEAVQP